MKQRTIQSGNLHSEQRRISFLGIGERGVRQGDEFAQECAKALEGFADSFVFGGVGGWVFPATFAGDLHEEAQGVMLG